MPFALDDQQTTLRLFLRESVPPNGTVDIQIKFKGSVPEIDPEETGLVTHVLQQVSAAIRNTREIRRARDTNFVCRGVMMLATSFPILAARNGDEWIRKIESSIGDSLTWKPCIGTSRKCRSYARIACPMKRCGWPRSKLEPAMFALPTMYRTYSRAFCGAWRCRTPLPHNFKSKGAKRDAQPRPFFHFRAFRFTSLKRSYPPSFVTLLYSLLECSKKLLNKGSASPMPRSTG